MKFLVDVLVTVFLSSSVYCQQSICRNCCSDRVMVYGRAEICAENEWCEDSTRTAGESVLKNELRYENATYVTIFPNAVSNSIRYCSVQNFKKLETIYGENMEITAIELKAFWNLPALRTIYLAFNSLREIQFGVFSNLPVTVLDLSWNKITFVGENSFAGMTNLQVLNISHNDLVLFDIRLYDNLPIKELILSYNLLERVDIGFKLNVTFMDLSFNKIREFELYYNRTYKKVDLTNNYLSKFTFGGGSVEDLRLSLNNLTNVDVFLNENILIKTITLYPNPWHCINLDIMLKSFKQRNITVIHPSVDSRLNFVYKDYPICAAQNPDAFYNYHKLRQSFIRGEETTCKSDNQCANFMICRAGTCWDPCRNNACRNYVKRCETKNHKFTCKCPLGQLNQPYELFSDCYSPCFDTSDCPNRKKMHVECYENICGYTISLT